MGKSDQIATEINVDIKAGKSIAQIKTERQIDDSSWQRYSAKAYALNLKEEKKKRSADEKKQHVATTSSVDMGNILALNIKLADFAIILPVTSTLPEFNHAVKLANQLPDAEPELLELVERLTMQPLFRARQKKGRFEIFPFFKPVHKLIDAATLCFYRKNYISCYMTLVPVIEGIMLRWLNYNGGSDKPDFEELRRFFNNGYVRQPMPWNIQFHEIFSKACGSLIEKHFFKHSDTGDAHDLLLLHRLKISQKGKGFKNIISIFDSGIDHRANNCEADSTLFCSKQAGYFGFDFDVSDGPFGAIVIRRHLRVVQEGKYAVPVFLQSLYKSLHFFMRRSMIDL